MKPIALPFINQESTFLSFSGAGTEKDHKAWDMI
jgi:hypothetical protein